MTMKEILNFFKRTRKYRIVATTKINISCHSSRSMCCKIQVGGRSVKY